MKEQKYVGKYSCQLVRESVKNDFTEYNITSPDEAAETIRKLTGIHKSPSEKMVVLMFNTKLKVLGWSLVSSGGLTATHGEPREVFRTAILANAFAILISHNHPSGNVEPSEEDKLLTKRLVEAGEILGIRVLDHIIISDEGYTSIKEEFSDLIK